MYKAFLAYILLLLTFFAVKSNGIQEPPEWDDPQSLPQWMTPEERLRKDEIGRGFVKTPAPLAPVRSIAEFERLSGVIIRYPLGIPLALVTHMSQHAKVYTIVGSNWQQNQAINAFSNAGANMENCEFIQAPTNSYWTRDYGPWFIADGNNQVAIVDFPYNRPRPADNAIPAIMADYFDLPLYGMDVVHTGGNYMSDGLGQAASTDLVYTENQNNQDFVNNQMEAYLGIDNYHVTIDAPGSYIEHIDTWAKFLDVDKILIGEVPGSHPRYWAYEQVADYFSNQISSYGTPYEVVRVYTPNGEPYTNSLILNETVYVPIAGTAWDDNALQTYEDAMPGYEVIGFEGDWFSTDALHCRVKDVADPNMLYIEHFPVQGEFEYQPEFEISAEIIPYSGADLVEEELFVHYKANEGQFESIPLLHDTDHTYTAMLPVGTSDTLITYYLSAADASGRNETWPLIGEPGARSFHIAPHEDLEYEILVFVHDGEENPLDGAYVSIDGQDLVTDTNGEINLQLPAGDYAYTAEMDCYLADEGTLSVTDYDKEITLGLDNMPGDANDDGIVDILDVISIVNYFAGENPTGFCVNNADVNQDGVIDLLDVIATVAIIESGK